MRKLLLFIVVLSCFVGARAQYFQSGEDPASIKWRQLNTDNFQLIYPDYYETKAQKLAHVLEKVYEYGTFSLDHKPEKISVILHTQTVQSNGLVGWAPKRAEFYTTPHQGIYPQDWLEQLALHEFRHVVQIDKINENLPGLIKAILGEQGTALVFGIHLPWWFIEGDAVVAETAMSNYGRGRLPSFLMEHRAQVVEKGIFSYDKSYFGSYRDFIPNHYKLGYYLVGGSRVLHGSNLWEPIVTLAGKKPFTISPVRKVLKQKLGITKTGLYYSVFDSLNQVWINEDQNYISANTKKVSPSKQTFTNYDYNHWLNDSVILSYKTSFNEIPAFVKIGERGNEEKLFRPGSIFSESVSYQDNYIIWSEQINDPRWTHSGKSLIRILNANSKSIIEIDTEFKSFSPAIAPGKTRFVVVETDFSNNYFLSTYQIPDGKLLNRFQTKSNNYFFSPQWINNSELVAVMLTGNGKRLVRVNPEKGKLNKLHNNDLGEINDLKVVGDTLYFISSLSGKNSLYQMNLQNKKISHLHEPRFGAASPAVLPNREEILFSDYTAEGYSLKSISFSEITPVPVSGVKKASYKLAEILTKQGPGIPDFSKTDTVEYPSSKYNKTRHLLNFHSWAPVFINIDSYEFWPGASLMSQNKLGTAETILGYRYYLAEKTGQFYANYKFKGWYPVFNIELNGGKRASDFTVINQIKNQEGQIISQDTTRNRIEWGEINTRLDAWLPLNFNKGPFNRRLQPQIGYNYTVLNYNEAQTHHFTDGAYHTAKYRLYYHQLLRSSYRDIYPGFGFVLDFAFRNSPFGTKRFGNLATYQSVLYLPGIMQNHGIKIYGALQKKKLDGTRGFSDVLRYPRGWGKISTTEMFSSAFDYAMPLFYPDWKVDGLLYLKRANLVLFADFANLKGNVYKDNEIDGTFNLDISSFGTELSFDVHLFRFYAPINMGLRASYLPKKDQVYFDFLFSINFNSL